METRDRRLPSLPATVPCFTGTFFFFVVVVCFSLFNAKAVFASWVQMRKLVPSCGDLT